MPWDPKGSEAPNVGVVGDSDEATSFKTGTGDREGHTLIADGDHSDDAKGFDANHDHHGPGFSAERGAYTGPGSSDDD